MTQERYKIIKGDRLEFFEEEVNRAISEGFEPLGAPMVKEVWIYQAMYKPRATEAAVSSIGLEIPPQPEGDIATWSRDFLSEFDKVLRGKNRVPNTGRLRSELAPNTSAVDKKKGGRRECSPYLDITAQKLIIISDNKLPSFSEWAAYVAGGGKDFEIVNYASGVGKVSLQRIKDRLGEYLRP